ncbi:MAG: tail fiber domain-containing protein, partial [Pseudomonadota bacterium]
ADGLNGPDGETLLNVSSDNATIDAAVTTVRMQTSPLFGNSYFLVGQNSADRAFEIEQLGPTDYRLLLSGSSIVLDGDIDVLMEGSETLQFTNIAAIEATGTNADFDFQSSRSFNVQLGNDNSSAEATAFRILDNTGVSRLRFFPDTGNLGIDGTLTQMSDRYRKHDIKPVEPLRVLDRVLSLELSEWSYLEQQTRHLGPMAQDFHAAFGLGENDTSIASVDADGVALAAIQGLAQRTDDDLDALLTENETLSEQVTSLQQRVATLETRLGQLEQLLLPAAGVESGVVR